MKMNKTIFRILSSEARAIENIMKTEIAPSNQGSHLGLKRRVPQFLQGLPPEDIEILSVYPNLGCFVQ